MIVFIAFQLLTVALAVRLPVLRRRANGFLSLGAAMREKWDS